MLGKLLAAVVVVAVLVPSATGSRPNSADRRLDQALAKLVSMPGGPPGVVAIVQRGSHRVVFNHGVASRSPTRAIALGDRWRIASVSKAFSGAAALKLVAHGRLRLEDTIGKRLPSLPKHWAKITLAELLQHTSGLRDYTGSDRFHAQVNAHPRQGLAPTRLLSYVAGDPPQFTPGTKYRYSNTDNVVVGFFVRAATGRSYGRALKKVVLDPLGLHQTALPATVRMPVPYVHGYDGKTDVSEALNPTLAWASGGIVSSPVDLTRFIRAYAGGHLFGGATRAAQRRFRPGESEPAGPGVNSAGLGIFRYQTSCGTVFGHTGNFLGYTAFIAASPNGHRSVTIQVSTQLSRGSGDPKAFQALRNAFSLGVCAAMS